MQSVALVAVVQRLTDSGVQLGLNVAFQFLPMLLLGAWAGSFADRHDKWRLVLSTQTALGVTALVLGIVELSGGSRLWLMHALAMVTGLFNAFDNPVRRGLLAELVDPSMLSNAMSLNTAVMTGSRAVGPALAGLLLTRTEPGWIFVINGVSYLAMLAGLTSIDQRARRVTRSHGPAKGQTAEGLRVVWAHPILRPAFVALIVVSTFSFNYAVSLPLLAKNVFDGDSSMFGVMLAVSSVGSLAGALWLAGKTSASLRTMLLMAGVQGVAAMAVSASPTFALALVFCIPMGFGGSAFIASASGLFSSQVPAEMRGRALALQAMAFLGSTPIGGPITGVVGDMAGARWSLAYGGVISLLTVMFVGGLVRRHRAA
jgi:MFS family permease